MLLYDLDGVSEAIAVAAAINKIVPGSCAPVYGDMPDNERASTLDAFVRGRLQCVTNVGVLTTGFDAPIVDAIVMARPTRSRALFEQMVGRGTRPLKGVVDGFDTPELRRASILMSGKPDCLVVSVCGTEGLNELVTPIDMLAGGRTDEVVKRAKEITERPGNASKTIEEVFGLAEEELEDEKKRRQQEIKLRTLVQSSSHSTREVNIFGAKPEPRPRAPKHHYMRPPSPAQVAALEKNRDLLRSWNAKPIESMSMADAGYYLDKISSGPPSPKQANLLRRNGLDPAHYTRKTATQAISKILSGANV
jgi:superfamily II DNA/RNA helicase